MNKDSAPPIGPGTPVFCRRVDLQLLNLAGRVPSLPAHRLNLWGLCALLGVFLAGCATVTFPPVNLNEPGWTVRQGQAVWTRKRGGQGIAGDILLATRPDGQTFVQFSKTPFPLVVAQTTSQAWTFEVPAQNKRYSGHGEPPQRIIFLQLPRVLSGQPPPPGWTWKAIDNGGWHLENNVSGESLDVYFNP